MTASGFLRSVKYPTAMGMAIKIRDKHKAPIPMAVAAAGSLLGDPRQIGADFAFTALFIGLIAGFWKGRATAITVAAEGHAPLLRDAPTQRAIAEFLAAADPLADTTVQSGVQSGAPASKPSPASSPQSSPQSSPESAA